MARFVELDEYLDDTIELPYKGKWYVLHGADRDTGLKVTRAMNVAAHLVDEAEAIDADDSLDDDAKLAKLEALKAGTRARAVILDDSEEIEIYQLLLGHFPDAEHYDPERDVWQQLHDDRVGWPVVRHFGTTAMMWAARGQADAMAYWESVKPRPTVPAPQDRKPAQQKKTPAKKRTGSPTRSTTPKAAETETP